MISKKRNSLLPVKMIPIISKYVFQRKANTMIPMNQDARIPLLSSSTSVAQVLDDAPEVDTKDGKKKVVESFPSYETVKQYRKALILLYRCQNAKRKAPWPSPQKSEDLLDILKKYKSDLCYGHLQTNPNRTVNCVLRNAYKPGQLIRVLKNVWLSDTRTSIRDLFSISSRHQMLLRDQDVRNLRFSDCFATTIEKKLAGGKQQAVAVIFCLTEGKTVEPGQIKYSCAIRHENVHRCAVSAFAFHLFSILQTNGDFLNDENWSLHKVVRSRGGPMSSISKSQQYNATSEIFKRNGIRTSRVTHGGRHSSVIEGQNLGIPTDAIKLGGGWKDRRSCVETHYMDPQPSQWAKGIAGFPDTAFYLNRNRVNPPKSLQRAIFPWIENSYGEANNEWKEECDREMDEPDENEDFKEPPINQKNTDVVVVKKEKTNAFRRKRYIFQVGGRAPTIFTGPTLRLQRRRGKDRGSARFRIECLAKGNLGPSKFSGPTLDSITQTSVAFNTSLLNNRLFIHFVIYFHNFLIFRNKLFCSFLHAGFYTVLTRFKAAMMSKTLVGESK